MRVEVQRKDAAKHARRNSVMSSTDVACFYVSVSMVSLANLQPLVLLKEPNNGA